MALLEGILFLRKNGSFEELASRVQFKVHPFETIIVQTPSGGGYGEPNNGIANNLFRLKIF